MENVDYSLLHINRKIKFTYCGDSKVMLLRDLLKIISDCGGELIYGRSAIVNSEGKILDIQIEEMESGVK